MEVDLLSLKWNNHKTTFLDVISNLRTKAAYSDATLACNGEFYPVHRLVLSTCSEYFSAIFEHTSCKHPVVVLKDVECRNLKYLLDYMYIGEVNVKQNELASLVGAAEYLKIKGLAVPDDEPLPKSNISSKRNVSKSGHYESSSPTTKRRRIAKSTVGSFTNICDRLKVISPETPCELNFENTEFGQDPSCILPIKCEPLDNEIIDVEFKLDNSLEGENYHSSVESTKSSEFKLDEKNIGKEEQIDPSEENINEAGTSGDYDNDHYLINSAASSSQPQEIMSNSLDLPYQDVISQHQFFLSGNKNLIPQLADTLPLYKSTNKPLSLLPDALSLFEPVIEPLSSDPIAPSIREVEGKPNIFTYHCNLCNYSSTIKHHVRRHFAKHTGFKRFHCAYCEKKFTNKNNLMAHTLSYHLGKKPNVCSFCSFRTAEKSHFRRHMKVKHDITLPK